MLKYALLGLLAKEPRHGYDLKQTFERLLGGTWPLNIGQIYTTLNRLERDGLVRVDRVAHHQAPDRKIYALTPRGHEALENWLAEPVEDTVPLKEGVFIKILVHRVLGGGDADALIMRQRLVYLRTLAELSELRSDERLDPTTALLLEGAMLHVEADLKWLELCARRVPTGRAMDEG